MKTTILVPIIFLILLVSCTPEPNPVIGYWAPMEPEADRTQMSYNRLLVIRSDSFIHWDFRDWNDSTEEWAVRFPVHCSLSDTQAVLFGREDTSLTYKISWLGKDTLQLVTNTEYPDTQKLLRIERPLHSIDTSDLMGKCFRVEGVKGFVDTLEFISNRLAFQPTKQRGMGSLLWWELVDRDGLPTFRAGNYTNPFLVSSWTEDGRIKQELRGFHHKVYFLEELDLAAMPESLHGNWEEVDFTGVRIPPPNEEDSTDIRSALEISKDSIRIRKFGHFHSRKWIYSQTGRFIYFPDRMGKSDEVWEVVAQDPNQILIINNLYGTAGLLRPDTITYRLLKGS
ncbi:hypothetical protein KFE98_11325 [bacterium SCSIO 12741]|nr:hypothetical protein KFE98_11325 [bacterium SCSIO 12741]